MNAQKNYNGKKKDNGYYYYPYSHLPFREELNRYSIPRWKNLLQILVLMSMTSFFLDLLVGSHYFLFRITPIYIVILTTIFCWNYNREYDIIFLRHFKIRKSKRC